MTIKRYGTSSAPREDGCFVMFSEYEKVVAECGELRAETDSLIEALANCREAAFDEQVDNPYLDGAVGDPAEVPGFVKWELDRLRAAAKEQS
jgi:hypothetical protein